VSLVARRWSRLMEVTQWRRCEAVEYARRRQSAADERMPSEWILPERKQGTSRPRYPPARSRSQPSSSDLLRPGVGVRAARAHTPTAFSRAWVRLQPLHPTQNPPLEKSPLRPVTSRVYPVFVRSNHGGNGGGCI